MNHRAGIVLQLAADEQADAVELVLGNRRRLAVERHDVHDARALQDRQRVLQIEAREAVAGKQRPVDLLLAILPPAPAGNRRQERVDLLALELLANHLFVARSRPDREPLRRPRSVGWPVRAARLAAAASLAASRPSSYAFLTSSFFHSMMAWARSFSRYFWNSAFRLSVKTRSLICSRALSNGSVLAGVIASSLRI